MMVSCSHWGMFPRTFPVNSYTYSVWWLEWPRADGSVEVVILT